MVSRETLPDAPHPGWEVRSSGPRGTELRWRRDPAEALALAFTLGGTIAPAAPPRCGDCGEVIEPDQPAGYDYAKGLIHAGCCLPEPEVVR